MNGFLDSTVLADATLKDYSTRTRTRHFLGTLTASEVPQYAMKELSAGPLRAYIWVHNILAVEQSYLRVLARIHRRSRTPQRNQTSSSIEALIAGEDSLQHGRLYPSSAADRAEHIRLTLKRLIFAARFGGNRIPGRMTFPLRCHTLRPPAEGPDGLISQSSHRCHGSRTCSQAAHLQGQLKALTDVTHHLNSQAVSGEDHHRRDALHRVLADEPLSESQCRYLGDAVFAILAPPGFVIVTTNTKDHEPLASVLGKRVIRP